MFTVKCAFPLSHKKYLLGATLEAKIGQSLTSDTTFSHNYDYNHAAYTLGWSTPFQNVASTWADEINKLLKEMQVAKTKVWIEWPDALISEQG